MWKDTTSSHSKKLPAAEVLVFCGFNSCFHWRSLKITATLFNSTFKEATVNHVVHCDKVKMCVRVPPGMEEGPGILAFFSLYLSFLEAWLDHLNFVTWFASFSLPSKVLFEAAWIFKELCFHTVFSPPSILSCILEDYILKTIHISCLLPAFLTFSSLLFVSASSQWD